MPLYGLRLEHGSQDVPAVEREIIRLLPPGTTQAFHVTSAVTGEVERASRPEAIALGVFGAIAGAATLLIACGHQPVPAPAHRFVAFEGALVAGGEPAGRPVRVTDARRRARIGYSLCAAARMTVATA